MAYLEKGVFQLLLRKGRMTVRELLGEINVFGFNVDQYDISCAIAILEYKGRVVYSFGSQKCDPEARRPYYEAIYRVCS